MNEVPEKQKSQTGTEKSEKKDGPQLQPGEWIAACATDDGTLFVDRHFGDADYYDIYKIGEAGETFIKRIDNTVDEEEEVHADPKKARGIAGILKKEGVSVTISKMYGPNIKRIRKKFVCIKADTYAIADALQAVLKKLPEIQEAWDKGEERSHLRIQTTKP
ncbi:MAG: NifB/NifX family molybdenum-iron cluster-binding protein [Spirochaetia bacterium]|nr:NifB/NifX family molybdenum-iron cluster-binding protein [Spirochaetia bacterium]